LLDENAHGRLGILGLLCVWIYLLGSMERLEKVIERLWLMNICAYSCALWLRSELGLRIYLSKELINCFLGRSDIQRGKLDVKILEAPHYWLEFVVFNAP
jgi:hypothetical protein